MDQEKSIAASISDTALTLDDRSSLQSVSTSQSTLNFDEAQAAFNNALQQQLQQQPQDPIYGLFQGNLICDCSVAPLLLARTPNSSKKYERDEFSHVRYTAITCGPIAFPRKGYVLRPSLFAKPRSTGILVSLMLRREKLDEVLRTFLAVRAGVQTLCELQKPAWGRGAWKGVMFAIVCLEEPRPEVRAFLAVLGIWVDDIRAHRVNDKRVKGHLFEYTTRVSFERNHFDGTWEISPSESLQMMLYVPEQPGTSFQADQWIVAAFGSRLQPRVWIPLKAGATPAPGDLYEAWIADVRGPNPRFDPLFSLEDEASDSEDFPSQGPAVCTLDRSPKDERYQNYVIQLEQHLSAETVAKSIKNGKSARVHKWLRNLNDTSKNPV